jgi:hypothetical protein
MVPSDPAIQISCLPQDPSINIAGLCQSVINYDLLALQALERLDFGPERERLHSFLLWSLLSILAKAHFFRPNIEFCVLEVGLVTIPNREVPTPFLTQGSDLITWFIAYPNDNSISFDTLSPTQH